MKCRMHCNRSKFEKKNIREALNFSNENRARMHMRTCIRMYVRIDLQKLLKSSARHDAYKVTPTIQQLTYMIAYHTRFLHRSPVMDCRNYLCDGSKVYAAVEVHRSKHNVRNNVYQIVVRYSEHFDIAFGLNNLEIAPHNLMSSKI